MNRYCCTVCGHIHSGEGKPAQCMHCGAPADALVSEQDPPEKPYPAEHVPGIAAGVSTELLDGLNASLQRACLQVGAYLAMARAAECEGYIEVSSALREFAHEQGDHAALLCEMTGDTFSTSTQVNVEQCAQAAYAHCDDLAALAMLAKQQNLDAIHDALHEMARDEARYGKAFTALIGRYFI